MRIFVGIFDRSLVTRIWIESLIVSFFSQEKGEQGMENEHNLIIIVIIVVRL